MALVVFGTLLFLEVGVRLVAKWTLHERGLTYDEHIGWRYLPNIRKVGQFWSAKVPAQTNARGWRDADLPLERSLGHGRIVAIGDSFTFGVTVDYGERFTEYLEQSVPNLEVVNLGLNASGTDQHLRILQTEALAYHPDVVVHVAFLGNDLEDIRNARKNWFSKPYYDLDGDRLTLVPPTITWDVRLRCSVYLAEFGMRIFDRLEASTSIAPSWEGRDTTPLFVALTRRIHEVAAANGAHCLTFLAYPRERLKSGPWTREKKIVASLERAEIAFVDGLAVFGDAACADEAVFAPDGHWSAAGHHLVAVAIEQELRRRGWLR